MENSSDTKALYIVINAGYSDDVMAIAREAGAKGATIMNARSEGVTHTSVMGISVDSEREIILTLIDGATAEKIMSAVKEHAGIETPAQGVCFTIPVEKTTLINNFPV
jgi:hypothetical protein